MSRSYREPYHSTVCISRGSMGKWKKNCNRVVRRIPIEEEIPDLSYIRRLNNRWEAPDDGRCRAHADFEVKCRRK